MKTRMPHPHYYFLCSVDRENGIKSIKLERHITGNMFTKFEVDRTSTLSKTTSTKNFNQNFNLKRDRLTNERTDQKM